jgi:hypothetical protein
MVHTPFMNLIAGLVVVQLLFLSLFLYKYFTYTSFYSPWFQNRNGVAAPRSLSTDALDPVANRIEPIAPPSMRATDKALAQTTWDSPLGITVDTSEHVMYASPHDAAEKKSLDVFALCIDLAVHKERCPYLQKHVYQVLAYDIADLTSTFDITDDELLRNFLVTGVQQKYFREASVQAIALMDNTDKYDFDKPHGVERASMFVSYHLTWFDETAQSLSKYKRGRIAYEENERLWQAYEAEQAALAAASGAGSASSTTQVKSDL